MFLFIFTFVATLQICDTQPSRFRGALNDTYTTLLTMLPYSTELRYNTLHSLWLSQSNSLHQALLTSPKELIAITCLFHSCVEIALISILFALLQVCTTGGTSQHEIFLTEFQMEEYMGYDTCQKHSRWKFIVSAYPNGSQT